MWLGLPSSRSQGVTLHGLSLHRLEVRRPLVLQKLLMIVIRQAQEEVVSPEAHEHVSVHEGRVISEDQSDRYPGVVGKDGFEELLGVFVRSRNLQPKQPAGLCGLVELSSGKTDRVLS